MTLPPNIVTPTTVQSQLCAIGRLHLHSWIVVTVLGCVISQNPVKHEFATFTPPRLSINKIRSWSSEADELIGEIFTCGVTCLRTRHLGTARMLRRMRGQDLHWMILEKQNKIENDANRFKHNCV